MCSAAGMGALGFAQNLFGSIGQHQNAKAEYNAMVARNQMAKMQYQDEANMRAANAYMNYGRLQEAQRESNVEASTQKFETNRAMRKALAMAQLGAIEGGIGGAVMDRAAQDLGFTGNQKIAAIEVTRQNELGQLEEEKTAQWLHAQMSPLYLYTPAKPKFNAMGAVLGGLSGFLNAGGSFGSLGSCGTVSGACGYTGGGTTSPTPSYTSTQFSNYNNYPSSTGYREVSYSRFLGV